MVKPKLSERLYQSAIECEELAKKAVDYAAEANAGDMSVECDDAQAKAMEEPKDKDSTGVFSSSGKRSGRTELTRGYWLKWPQNLKNLSLIKAKVGSHSLKEIELDILWN